MNNSSAQDDDILDGLYLGDLMLAPEEERTRVAAQPGAGLMPHGVQPASANEHVTVGAGAKQEQNIHRENQNQAQARVEQQQPNDLRLNEHVTIWNRVECRKVAGNAAPMRRNVHKYLAAHPECEVYNGQDKQRLAVGEVDARTGRVIVRENEHVAIWHRTERRKITGNAAPLRQNLHAYLKRNPHCEVYASQDKVGPPQDIEAAGGTFNRHQPPKTKCPAPTHQHIPPHPQQSVDPAQARALQQQQQANLQQRRSMPQAHHPQPQQQRPFVFPTHHTITGHSGFPESTTAAAAQHQVSFTAVPGPGFGDHRHHQQQQHPQYHVLQSGPHHAQPAAMLPYSAAQSQAQLYASQAALGAQVHVPNPSQHIGHMQASNLPHAPHESALEAKRQSAKEISAQQLHLGSDHAQQLHMANPGATSASAISNVTTESQEATRKHGSPSSAAVEVPAQSTGFWEGEAASPALFGMSIGSFGRAGVAMDMSLGTPAALHFFQTPTDIGMHMGPSASQGGSAASFGKSLEAYKSNFGFAIPSEARDTSNMADFSPSNYLMLSFTELPDTRQRSPAGSPPNSNFCNGHS